MTNVCNLCHLSSQCLSPVLQSKISECEVLIVCDQPDSKADFEGKPFAGPLGALLLNLTKKAGLRSCQSVYSVKCSTVRGETLHISSIDACRSYLKDDIAHSRPRYILCMGDVALRAVTKRSGVRNNRGNPLSAIPELNTDAKVFCTYSLEYLAQNSNMERTVISDFRRCADQKTDTEVPWKIWEGEELDGDILAYDIEAVDDNGAFTEYPTQIAVANDEICYVSRDVHGLGGALRKAKSVGHNSLHYDSPMLRKQGISVEDYHDTMYMAFFLDETQPRGLEALSVKYLGVPGWKESFSAKLGSEEFYFYNARDAWYTMQLFRLFKRELESNSRLALLENLIYPVRKAFDDMSKRGVSLCPHYILSEKEATSSALGEKKKLIIAEMAKLLPYIERENLNPNSNNQISICMNKKNLWHPLTEKGNPQVSKDILNMYKSDPLIKDLLEYKTQTKKLSTYIRPYEKLMNEGDGRAHPEYKMTSVDTGRTSAVGPNVQNLDRKLKGFFNAAKGKVLLSADYSAIEFRVASFLANETKILSLFAKDPSWDPHKFFASFFYGIEESQVTKDQRQIAKSANFSQLYIGNGFTLYEYAKKQGVELNLALCERVHEKWHQLFPGFNRYYEEKKHEILSTGCIKCPTGFTRHFGDPDLIRANYGNKFLEKLRQAVNVPVQNLSTHIAFLAIRRFQELGYPMVLFVHDSISFELEEDRLDEKIKEIEEIMCNYPVKALKDEFNVNLTIPLKIEIEVK